MNGVRGSSTSAWYHSLAIALPKCIAKALLVVVVAQWQSAGSLSCRGPGIYSQRHHLSFKPFAILKVH